MLVATRGYAIAEQKKQAEQYQHELEMLNVKTDKDIELLKAKMGIQKGMQK